MNFSVFFLQPFSEYSQDEFEEANPERLSEADNWETCGRQTELRCRLQR